MRLAKQIRAAMEMVRSVGIQPTIKTIGNFARARMLHRSRVRQFRRMGLREPIVREVLGSRMKLDPQREGLDRDLLMDGIREPMATGHIMRLLRPDDVVFEVGANIGYYALMEARICRKVYAVEPHPENFDRLNENVALNGYDNIETFNFAFGAEPAELPMFCSELSNWHSLRDVESGAKGTINVPVTRIDDFVAEHEAPDFIKMDVEGYELEVLKGATETLKQVRCVFLEIHGDILTHDEQRELLDLIKRSGLKAHFIVQYDRPGLARTRDPSHVDQIYAGDRGTYELFFSRAEAGAAPGRKMSAT